MAQRTVVLMCLLVVLGGCATTGGGSASLPVPPDIRFTAPASAVPPELAAFSGTWEGIWSSAYGQLPSRLIVESIEKDSARVVYIWGDDPNGNFKAGWGRNRAKVIPGGKLEFGSPQVKFRFHMAEDRLTIEGEREQAGQIATVTMKKVAQ
jgi:hypothetical protein